MITWLKWLILWCLRPLERRGIQFTMRRKTVPPSVLKGITKCMERSLCSFSRFDTVWRALRYIEENNIPGDVVLCGVARGGLARFLALHMPIGRRLWLYDSFDGGSRPGVSDNEPEVAEAFKQVMATQVDEVKRYVGEVVLPPDSVKWVVGDILKTIPYLVPENICLLYLDTDFYESTAHEMRHLEPLVSDMGIIIQDEMLLCHGAGKAVHEYYATRANRPFITAIDEAACVWQKPYSVF